MDGMFMDTILFHAPAAIQRGYFNFFHKISVPFVGHALK
jgi:hypothetical protein